MNRSRAFRPSGPLSLEGRVVLSQVLSTPVTGIVAHPRHAEVARASSPAPEGTGVVREVGQTRLADGKVLVTSTTITHLGPGETSTAKVTREPDGTSKVVDETSTTSAGTTTITKSITLPDGARQTETGTDQTQGSTTTILPDGALQANPGSSVIASTTTTFDHVIVQPGQGTETIVGTTVRESSRGRSIAVTDQQVTHFDGSQGEVKIVTIGRGKSSTIRTSTTPADGATTTTVRTARMLSSTRS